MTSHTHATVTSVTSATVGEWSGGGASHHHHQWHWPMWWLRQYSYEISGWWWERSGGAAPDGALRRSSPHYWFDRGVWSNYQQQEWNTATALHTALKKDGKQELFAVSSPDCKICLSKTLGIIMHSGSGQTLWRSLWLTEVNSIGQCHNEMLSWWKDLELRSLLDFRHFKSRKRRIKNKDNSVCTVHLILHIHRDYL